VTLLLTYPPEGYVPQIVWSVLSDLGAIVAVIAVFSAIAYGWKRGPVLLIKYGPDWWTRLGHRWGDRRNAKEGEMPDTQAEYDPMQPPPEGIPADPLDKVEGDSSETDRWDDNDTPPEAA
jgi:hypothetical protein